ncbi:MAG: DUF2057 domain-containing protein [Colwellia sp.]|jgi:hypothetical protein|nr:MAG: DUF2057 domain-containing protein [Colwellia sp.]
MFLRIFILTRFLNVPSLTALFIFGSLSVISPQVFAATVNVSDNLVVSEVNDKSIDNGFLGKKSSFKLNPGNHALIVRYKDVFEDLEFAEERRVESQDFVVKFTITDQKQLKLSTIKIKDLAAAESFKKSPKLKLKDGHDNQLNLTLEKVADYKLAKQVDLAVSALASKQIIQTKSSVLPTASTVATQKSANTLIQVNALTMLKHWWQNASNDEKQRFKQFTQEN